MGTTADNVNIGSNIKVHGGTSTFQSMYRPYFELARLHKFGRGTLLIYWPSAWALTMAAYRTRMDREVLITQLAVFFIRDLLVHGAVCTLNDICDIDFDRQVERTKNRPLAAGTVSISAAWAFCIVQTGVYVAFLTAGNRLGLWLGLIGLCPIHALYPLMKRITYWPQAWLGFAMNWGWVIGWVTATEHVDVPLIAVFLLGAACWTIVYDTIYAIQDKNDDIKAGVKSTAILFGDHVKVILSIFAVVFVASIGYAGVKNAQGPVFFVVSVGGTAVHFAWQLWTLRLNDPADCAWKFRANSDLGFLLWFGAAIDYGLLM